MTRQELQQTFESRAQDLKGFIYWRANGNEDMVQEASWRKQVGGSKLGRTKPSD